MLHIIIGEGLSPWLFFVAIYGSGCLSTNAMGSPTVDGMEPTMVANNGWSTHQQWTGQNGANNGQLANNGLDRTEWSQQWLPKMDRLEHTRTHMPIDSNDTNQYTQWPPPPLRQ